MDILQLGDPQETRGTRLRDPGQIDKPICEKSSKLPGATNRFCVYGTPLAEA